MKNIMPVYEPRFKFSLSDICISQNAFNQSGLAYSQYTLHLAVLRLCSQTLINTQLKVLPPHIVYHKNSDEAFDRLFLCLGNQVKSDRGIPFRIRRYGIDRLDHPLKYFKEKHDAKKLLLLVVELIFCNDKIPHKDRGDMKNSFNGPQSLIDHLWLKSLCFD